MALDSFYHSRDKGLEYNQLYTLGNMGSGHTTPQGIVNWFRYSRLILVKFEVFKKVQFHNIPRVKLGWMLVTFKIKVKASQTSGTQSHGIVFFWGRTNLPFSYCEIYCHKHKAGSVMQLSDFNKTNMYCWISILFEALVALVLKIRGHGLWSNAIGNIGNVDDNS